MKREAFDFWASTLIRLLEVDDFTSRSKHSEILATFRLLQKHMVLLNSSAVYVKRIHNPNRSDRVRSPSSNRNQRSANFIQVIHRHWNSSVSIFGVIKIFHEEFNSSEFLLYFFLGTVAFVSAWIDFLYIVFWRNLMKR